MVEEVSKVDSHDNKKIATYFIKLTVDCGRRSTENWMEFLWQ